MLAVYALGGQFESTTGLLDNEAYKYVASRAEMLHSHARAQQRHVPRCFAIEQYCYRHCAAQLSVRLIVKLQQLTFAEFAVHIVETDRMFGANAHHAHHFAIVQHLAQQPQAVHRPKLDSRRAWLGVGHRPVKVHRQLGAQVTIEA
jgi:hypothetical protein